MSNRHHGLRQRSLALTIAAAVGLSVSAVALAATPAGSHFRLGQAPSSQPSHGKFVHVRRATLLNHGSVIRGRLASSKSMHITVTLKARNTSELSRLARTHARLSHTQMSAKFFPTQSQAQSVADYLRKAGFTNVAIAPNRMSVSAKGSAAVVQSAFQTSLSRVLTSSGRRAFANTSAVHIPAALAGSVQAVLGLQNVHRAHTMRTRAHRIGPVGSISYHYAPEFASIYDAASLPPALDIPVGVWGWGSMAASQANLGTFTQVYGYPTIPTTVVCTDYPGPNGPVVSTSDATCATSDMGQLEWSMDSQSIVAMTGGVAHLTFYGAQDPSGQGLYNALQEIVTPTAGETRPMVVNASFGLCEVYAAQGGENSLAAAEDTLFQMAAVQYGMTFTVSTGDDGANECGSLAPNRRAAASWPAASPWVVAVAGTVMRTTTGPQPTLVRQNTWINSGGSPSSFEAAQPWQAPLTYSRFAGARGPDVAFDASPSSGTVVVIGQSGYIVGGTSLAAPLFAGAWARILETNPSLGFAAPHLYDLPASALMDVRSGSNKGWMARRGWDYATGLGSIDVAAAAAALAGQTPQ